MWAEDEQVEFVDFIATNPKAGDIIPDTGGIRKIRWSRQGGGKRDGVRVIYFYDDEAAPLYLLMVYAKARRQDLSSSGKRTVKALAAVLKEKYRRKGHKLSEFEKDLIQSLTEAVAHAKGEANGVRIQVIEVPDLRAIRVQLRMSQTEFAEAYRIPLATLKGWEQGRRHPESRPAPSSVSSSASPMPSCAHWRIDHRATIW